VAAEAACTVTVVRPPRSAVALLQDDQDGRKPKALEA
jgi:hypothetical protein